VRKRSGGDIREREEAKEPYLPPEGGVSKGLLKGGERRVSFSLADAASVRMIGTRERTNKCRAAVASTFITRGKSCNSIMRLTSNSNTIKSPRRKGAGRAREPPRMF